MATTHKSNDIGVGTDAVAIGIAERADYGDTSGNADSSSDYKIADLGSGAGKKRGRQSGNSNAGTAGIKTGTGKNKKTQLDIKATANQLKYGHELLATFVGEKNPQLRELLKLSDSEAQNMAEAVCNVTQYYDITPNPVVMAWINLAVVAGAVYVPRIVLYQQMTK